MLNKEEIREWMVRYQIRLVEERYKDIPGSKDILNFFSNQIYCPPKEKIKHKERDETLKALRHSTATRLLLLAMPIRIRRGVNKIIELYDQTNNLEDRLLEVLYGITKEKRYKTVSEITPEDYKRAFRESASINERKKQVQNVIEVAGFVQSLVERESIILETAINFLAIYGVTRIITDGYNLFKAYRKDLEEFKKILKREELKFLENIYKKG